MSYATDPLQATPIEEQPLNGDALDSSRAEFVSGFFEALHEVNVKLADQQADSASPLYSANTFEELGLDENLLKGIYSMKFVKPSKVQARALPLLINDPPQNLIGQSQSGTGKTAAFSLAMLKRVDVSLGPSVVQAVCLAPTRELARQIMDVVQAMGQFTSVTVTLAGREAAPGTRGNAPIAANIVIGTPGTILDLERRRALDLSQVKVFVLDEADVMLDRQGLGVQSLRVKSLCPLQVQTVLFSATFTPQVVEFATAIAPNANQFTLQVDELTIDSIKQYYIDCQGFQGKFAMLSAIYGLLTVSQSIIFVQTRDTADQVQHHMQQEGHVTAVIHGGMTPGERDTVIDSFRAGRCKVLIATNVLARGIDILQVSLVINFDLPTTPDRMGDPETYLHRIGRTGRFGRSGVAINFVHNRTAMEVLLAFERYFKRPITYIPSDSLEAIEAKLNELKASGSL
jgi:ATP-dependent RNA helicase DDX19/DBP5